MLSMATISYSKDAIKALRRMPRPVAQRIQRKVAAYAEDPAAQRNNVKALVGSD